MHCCALVALVSYLFLLASAETAQNPLSIDDDNPETTAAGIIDWKVQLYIRKMMLQHQIPGLTLAVVKDGQEDIQAFGFRGEWGERATVDTLFDIGSCSKAFATMALGILMDDYRVGRNTTPLPPSVTSFDWQTKVKDILPGEWELQDPWATEKANLGDILSHVSGLGKHDLSYAPGQTVESRVKNLKHLKMTHELREKWNYNNIMYMTLGRIMDKYTGSFTKFVTERILRPAGMTSTRYSESVPPGSNLRSQGWDAPTGRRIPLIDPAATKLIAAAGGLVTNAKDMAKWLKLLLLEGKDPLTERQILPKEVVADVTSSRAIMAGVTRTKALSDILYGAGWARDTYKGRHRTWHTGGVHGFQSFTGFFPLDNLGIFLSMNKWNAPGVDQLIVDGIVDLILGLPSLEDELDPTSDRLLLSETFGNPLIPRTDLDDFIAQVEAKKTNQSQLELASISSYGGRYTHPVFGSVNICDLSSNSHEDYCSKARRDFKSVAITDNLGAAWLRVWGTHVYLSPLTSSIFIMYLRSVFPQGYGWNKRSFFTENGVAAGVMIEGKGLGFYEDLDTLPTDSNPGLQEVMDSCQAWFSYEAFGN